ncbi:MAG TPA: MxaK protein [Burkholderiales bacterium]|nr:MxaK protein [Burkholderiales bacterium]
MALNRKMRFALYFALACIVAAAVEGYQLDRIHALDRAIRDGSVLMLSGELPYEVLFAKAYFLDHGGKHQEALSLYQRVINEGGAQLSTAAMYNSANLNFREALAKRSEHAEGEALPLIELAKQSYREVLRAESGNWDVRYNLERALRLAPEKEEGDAAALLPPLGMERAITTMKAFTLGLP